MGQNMEKVWIDFWFSSIEMPRSQGSLTGSLQNRYQPGRVFVGYMTNFRHSRSAVDNVYLYPCWWPTIFSITSQCSLGLRLHYPVAPIASTPYDMSGRCYHRMVVARAEYLFSAKDWKRVESIDHVSESLAQTEKNLHPSSWTQQCKSEAKIKIVNEQDL